jgi:hypothetical protein
VTTEPKARKPAEKASASALPSRRLGSAPKPASKEENQSEISEIQRLVARWNWAEADQLRQADMAPTEDESERLIAIHNDEQEKIEGQLAKLVPKSISEIRRLLEFATDRAEYGGCMAAGAEIDMLRNVKKGLARLERSAAKMLGA